MKTRRNRKNLNLNPTGDPWSPWLHVDIALVLSSIALAIIGAFMVYSATRGNDPESYDRAYLNRQLLFLVAGVVARLQQLIFLIGEFEIGYPQFFGVECFSSCSS